MLAACQMTTVLGVATDVLYRAIRSYYSSTGDSSVVAPMGVEQGYLDMKQAREYLQKIVQARPCHSNACTAACMGRYQQNVSITL